MNSIRNYDKFATKVANMVSYATTEQKKEIREQIMIRLVNAYLDTGGNNESEMREYVSYYKMKNRYD